MAISSTAVATAPDLLSELPLDIRARITAYLPYGEAVRLGIVSSRWRDFHDHTRVVSLDLEDIAGDTAHGGGVVGTDPLRDVYLSILLRGLQVEPSRLVTLIVRYRPLDARLRAWADLYIELADAPYLRLFAHAYAFELRHLAVGWAVVLPPSCTELEMITDISQRGGIPFFISGPGAAALRKLYVDLAVLREWPLLPSLCSLTLCSVTLTAPFPSGETYPHLEVFRLWSCTMEYGGGVDIHLPMLRVLHLDEVAVHTKGDPVHVLVDYYDIQARAYDVVICAPMLEELHMSDLTFPSSEQKVHVDDGPFAFGRVAVYAPRLKKIVVTNLVDPMGEFSSFFLYAPQLSSLTWTDQFVRDMDVFIGQPGDGDISFNSDDDESGRSLNDYRAQMRHVLYSLRPNAGRPADLDAFIEDTAQSMGRTRLSCMVSRLFDGDQ